MIPIKEYVAKRTIGKNKEACRQKASQLKIKYLGETKNQYERN